MLAGCREFLRDHVNHPADLLDRVRGYMVIQPGTHTLIFTYTVRVDGETSDRPIVKTVPERNFAQGCYTEVKHILQ